jgi:tetratricopeptide (TPR) repeat protein
MRKLNVKLLTWLVGSAVVVSVAVFALHWFQQERIARALLWQASRAEEQGQTDRMVEYLQRYLEFHPHDLEEKARMARALACDMPIVTPRTRQRALYVLDNVLVSDPGRSDLRRLLVKVALEIGKYKMARDHLQVLWKDTQARADQTPPRDRGELESAWGQLMEAENNFSEAMAWYRKAIHHVPDDLLSGVRLAYLLRKQPQRDPQQHERNHAEADQLLDELVTHNETGHQAYLARWRYRRDFDLVGVEAAGKGTPGHEKKLVLVKGTSRDAGEDVTRALQRAPETVEVLLAAADLERLLHHRSAALKHLRRGLELQQQAAPHQVAEGSRYQLLWQLTNLLLDSLADEKKSPEERNNDGIEVVQRIGQLRRLKGTGNAADFLEGRLRLLERRWAEAVVLLERCRPALAAQPEMRGVVNQVDIFIGQCCEQLEEPGQMFAAYRRVAEYDPNNPVALLGMGSAQWMQNRLDEAMVNYRKVMNLNQVPLTGWTDIARLEIQRQLQREPAKRDWKEAEEALEKAARGTARASELVMLRADVFAAQERFKEAEDLLAGARASSGKPEQQAEIYSALARLALVLKDRPRALTVIDEGQKALGDQVELRVARARFWATDKSKEAPIQLRKLEVGLKDMNLSDQARLLDELAEAHFRINHAADARRLCEQLANHPNHQSDLRLRLLLFDLALQAGDEGGMERWLEEIRTVERVQGAFHRYGLAQRLIWQARHNKIDRQTALREAQVQLDRVANLRPNWPPLFLARAQLQDLRGNTDKVIIELKQAIELGENSPAVIRLLVNALNERQRYLEADEEMQKLRKSLKINSELGRLAASVALRRGDPGRALQLARDAVQADSKDFREQVWLGRMLDASNVPEAVQQAEDKLRQAIKLAPTEPEPYVALVQFLANRKQEAAAALVLKEGAARIDPERRALAEGQCHEILGQWDLARAAYERSLKAQPNSAAVVRAAINFNVKTGRLPDAEALLRKLVMGQLQVNDTEVDWAKRALALLLADGTDFTRFQEALTLVGLKLDSRGQLVRDTTSEETDSQDLIRARARVLATQGQKQFRDRAVELFDLLARTQNLTAEDQFVLALLHDSAGAWAKSRAELLGVVLKQPQAPSNLVQLIRRLLREKELDDADRWLKQLEDLEKQRGVSEGTFATVELRAMLLEGRGEGQKALDLLQGHVTRREAKPEEVLLLVAALSRQKRFEEAFDLLPKVWTACRPEAAGAVSVALVRSMKPSDEQCLRVETLLKAACDKEPQKMVLRLHLADLYDMRGRYAEAEGTLRVVLRDDHEPHNVVALNNLAWLLAQRNGDGQEALRHINTALAGFGRRSELLDTRGIVYLALGRHDDALNDLKEVAADAPSASRLFHLARAHYEARDRESAARVLRRAQEMGLKADLLHPVEQKTCDRLMAELQLK